MTQNSLTLDTLLNNIETGVWITNSSGDILYTNHAYRQIRQLPKEWFDSHNAFQDHSDGITSISPTRVVCETKQEIHLVQHITGTEGGVSISLFVTCRPIFDANGMVEYVVGNVIPIEQLNQMYLESLLTDRQYYSTAPQFKAEPDIVAESPEMKQVLLLANQVADTKSTILISGESGVGKNVLAGYIHRRSARKDCAMVEINCAALPESLLEAELFGYEPGAFTNALRQGKRGLFDEAAGGTLFLDEINSMSLNLQSKLLRAIETKHIRRVGGTKDIPVDFRLITASNANLRELVEQGLFRGDLFYRLNVVHLSIPPLRERAMDIIPLCVNFIKRYCQEYDRVKVLSPSAYDRLVHYPWPGNVRELKNVAERIVIMTSSETAQIEDLPDALFDTWGVLDTPPQPISPQERVVVITPPQQPPQIHGGSFSLDDYLRQCERTILDQTFQLVKSTYKAAELLQISQSRAARLKRQYGIRY